MLSLRHEVTKSHQLPSRWNMEVAHRQCILRLINEAQDRITSLVQRIVPILHRATALRVRRMHAAYTVLQASLVLFPPFHLRFRPDEDRWRVLCTCSMKFKGSQRDCFTKTAWQSFKTPLICLQEEHIHAG